MSKNSKFFISFFILILPFLILHSQTGKIEINGIILDESNYAVPYVAVGIVKKHIGTASTEDGEFSFLVSNTEMQDTLSISSLGYDAFKIKISDYLKLEKKEIILKETITELEEIKILKPSEYVQNAIEHLKENTISKPHQIEMLYRRAATENGKSKFFVENYIKIRDRGPAYPLGLVQVMEARKSADYRIWKRKQWTHSLTWMATANPLRPTDKQPNLKRFTWKKIGDSSYEGEDVVIIKGIDPKSKTEVTLYIGVENFTIFRIEKQKALFLYKKYQDGRVYLSYYSNEWGFGKNQVPKEYWGTEAEKMTYRLEAFVYNIETNKKKIKIVPFGGDTDMGSLDLPYHPNFWSNLSMPPDTKFFKRIKKELESNYGVSLENQFKFVNK
ncbi:carboxypeptidase-like regulatory domain-containing protein [Seonamhaeicola maritimus]|uniref:Carboxypeptidase-like regulatory domain-containing protein n=1 Tax=Seonamhaeicola maritimus TaxID=2591822 RepID=A0A5C7GFC4_9FLAO|nr:carboxypeptidase-like regulatory domain-containing protein [Seonamhaeicola maritimus]TXG35444.1 carboxypeptidase-like regulatory domain-containing protein [Seonamhaeicola maritimus]